jgi:uncharacterized membrane protein YhhN
MFDVAPAPPIDAEPLREAPRVVRLFHTLYPAGDALLLLGLVFALAYGLFFFKRGPSLAKTLVKTGAVGALVLIAWIDGDPLLLTIALALCALGDAFLAGDPKRWLPFGLASFLAGHLAYVALFVTTLLEFAHHRGFYQRGDEVGPDAVHVGGMVVVVLLAAAMLRWLWASLGSLRLPVVAYVAAIVAMVCTSLALPHFYAFAQYGAVAFFASDAILSAQLFRQRFEGRAGQWAVWALYFVGQVLIMGDFSPVSDTMTAS